MCDFMQLKLLNRAMLSHIVASTGAIYIRSHELSSIFMYFNRCNMLGSWALAEAVCIIDRTHSVLV